MVGIAACTYARISHAKIAKEYRMKLKVCQTAISSENF